MKAFVFPGQGSQAVGMGAKLLSAFSSARETLEEVDDALRQNLTRLIAEGPTEQLMLTQNAQPAIMAVSIAALRVVQKEGNRSKYRGKRPKKKEIVSNREQNVRRKSKTS